MTQRTLIPEYRYSDRGRIQAGDTFRARGGPVYHEARVGRPGRYRLIDVEQSAARTYLVAVPVDRHGLPCGGTALLFVSGKPYRLRELPDWIVRPYRVSRLRK